MFISLVWWSVIYVWFYNGKYLWIMRVYKVFFGFIFKLRKLVIYLSDNYN